jgi:co-chaperonin GroES (HSP10)
MRKNDSGLEVTGECVLVKLLKVEEVSKGGIILAQSTQDRNQLAQQIGFLIDAGDLAMQSVNMQGIKIGDPVFFPRYSGTHFPVDGVDYWVMLCRHICGKATKLPDFMVWGARDSIEVFGVNAEQAA